MTSLPSYIVIHDGKMHIGEVNEKQQSMIVEMMNMTSNLIFLSKYVKDLVYDNYKINKPSYIAPHGLLDYGNIKSQPQRETPILLFLGRVSSYKGIDVLFEAMRHVPLESYDKLIVAGEWNYDLIDMLPNIKIDIVNKWLSNDEILHYIESCDIMVFPYIEATQSGVATLALNYEKPSIVTNVGAFKEQFSEKTALFIEPSSVTELANAITTLSRDTDRRNYMVKSMHDEKSKFTWSKIACELDQYIKTTSLYNRR
jgi:glycosyltransferase involved in cell wall biosynthesis